MPATEYLKKINGVNITIQLKINEMEWVQKMLKGILKIWEPYFQRHLSEAQILQSSIVKLSLREQEISEQLDELITMKETGEKLFDALQYPMHAAVLKHRYLEGQSFEKIAEEMNCGMRWVYRIHDRAIKEFEPIYTKNCKIS